MGATVLMIGDHTDTVRLVRMALEFTPYVLHIAPSVDEGLAMSRICKPDLLIMEGSLLGDIDSICLGGNPVWARLPLVILRDSQVKNYFDTFNSVQLKLFLNKPFTPLQLHHAMDTALRSELG